MANYSLRESLKQLGRKILGSCVNSCVSTATNLPLAANQGKVLQDQINTLNSNINKTMVKLGEYATNNSTGIGTNPIGDTTIKLSDDITNYRFLYIVSAFYPALTAVYGSINIPVSAFMNSGEAIMYPVRMGDTYVKFDYVGKNGNSNSYINLTCNSTYPMSVWGIK